MSLKNRYRVILLLPLAVFVLTLPVNLHFNQPLITFIPTLAVLFWSSRRIYSLICPICQTPLREGRFFLFGLDRCKRCGAALDE